MSTPQRVALVLVVNGDGQLLMGKRGDSGLYVIPGGHVEPGEEPEQAAIRELGEEAGLDVDKVSPVAVYPARPDRPELHLFSALAPMGVEPHGRRDPDQEVPTEDWEWVDARGGLPAKVLEHLHVPGDRNVLPSIYDLKKVQPPITFPKLGVGDDRRETPIVDSPLAVKSKLFALQAAAPPERRDQSPSEFAEQEGQHPGNGFASSVPGRHTGYSLSTGMRVATARPGMIANRLWVQHQTHPNADVSTVQHENFHQIMQRVGEKHGPDARRNLSRNLWDSIPGPDRKLADEFVRRRVTLPLSHPSHYEEKLASLSNWLNNPGERASMAEHYGWGSEGARKIDDAIKRAYRGLRTTAQTVDGTWLGERSPYFAGLGKAEAGEHCAICGARATARVRGASGRARAACAAHVGKVLSQHGEGVRAVEHLGKSGGQAPYPIAGPQVSGLTVRSEVPNLGSIGATFNQGEYTVHPGIREIPLSHFDSDPHHNFYSADDHKRVADLAERIRQSGEISPLIAVTDKEPRPYILEGGHRLGALHALGVKSVPALVVHHHEGSDSSSHELQPVTKAEVAPAPPTEVQTLLKHPDPRERALALKLGSATARDAAQAALDVDPWVWRAALNHPVHGAHAKAALAASNRDSSGALMHVQHAELRADPSLAPEHLQAMHRAWRDDQGNDLNLQVRVHEMGMTAAHPRFPREGLGKSEAARGRLKSGSTQSTADASREVAMPHVGHLAEAWHRAGPKKEDDPAWHDLATNNEDYISPKAIYSLPVAGHELPQRFMAKPYGERNDQMSGWAEGTSQALYHAAGIGHLHQDSFVAPHGHGDTAIPATVIHMVRGKTYNNAPLDTLKRPSFKADLARIALMDHAMSQQDRHDGNLLVREDNGKPLAIDNAMAFSPFQRGFKTALGGRLSEDEVTSALPWWKKASPDVRRALESRLSLIRDPHVRDSIARSFRGRADWLDQRAAEPVPNWKADVPLAKSLYSIPDEKGVMNKPENVPFSPEKMEGLHRELAAAPMPHVKERREHFEEHLNGSGKVVKPLLATDVPAHAVNRKGAIAGATRKAFYDSPAGHSFMVKGTHDSHHFGLGAWGEATSQALYHAAGIGDLHQHSHVSEIHDDIGRTAHGTVVHIEHDAPTFDFARENDMPRAEHLYLHPENDKKLRQIALMDAITDNYDRHGQNLLVRRDGSPLAIDNAKVFEQDMDHGNPIEDMSEPPLGMRSDAWQSTDGPNSETWRWYFQNKPKILEAVDRQLNLLPDREFRDKTRQRFLDRLKRVEEYKR